MPAGRDFSDDELRVFEAHGVALPDGGTAGDVVHDGAWIHHVSYGVGLPVVLLHGGLGHGGNWGHQVPALVAAGRRAIVIDSRGHGRSTRDERAYSYELLAGDVLAVMDALGLGKAAIVGWSDGACTGLVLARQHPARVAGVLFFACNMSPDGAKPFAATPVVDRCFSRHKQDYAALSATPGAFDAFVAAVGQMQRTEPNYSDTDLAEIAVPVRVVQSADDEFIRLEHAQYLARSIPGAELEVLEGVTHFAPLQRPALFNAVMLDFVDRLAGG